MAFANPIALLFLTLFIPIIALYLLKQRRRRVQIATLLFWDQILRDEQSVTSLSKLKKLLSLLLQLLIVALLTFALARPLLAKDMLGARRIVLYVDTSASMTAMEGDTTRFAKAKRLARDVARGTAIGDSIMVVAVTSQPDIVLPFTNSRKTAVEAVEALEVTHTHADFAKAFNLLEHLPPDERDTAVYVVSDGAFDPVEFEPPENVRFAYLPVGEADANAGITAFALRPFPASPRDFEILLEVTNASTEDARIPYEVRVNDGLVDAGEVTLGPGDSVTRSVRQFAADGGVVEVIIDSDDAFPLDNRAASVLPAPRPIDVLLVTDGNLFLETALATADEVVLETATPLTYGSRALGEDWDGHIKIFDRWAPETAPAGHAIFIGEWPETLGGKGRTLDDPLITDWDRDHPVNRHLHLTNVSIETAHALEPATGFTTLIQSFEKPLVALRESADGHHMLVAFDTTTSDLPLRVAFPILIGNALRHMAGTDADDAWNGPPVGTFLTRGEVDTFARRAHAHEHEAGDATVVLAPGEDAPEIFPTEQPTLTAVNHAGVYRFASASGETFPIFAANLTHHRESDIAPSESLPIQSANTLPELADSFRLGLEPWVFLIVLALLIVSAEWWLFHRRVVE